jgi:ABC-type transport system involved in cytochrome c biogenesis permease component
MVLKRIEQFVQLQSSERVHELVAIRKTDLQEAKFLRIGMKRIRFGIDGHPRRIDHARHQRVQTSLICNHNAGDIIGLAARKLDRQMANVGPPVISRLNHRFSKTLHTQRGPITIKIYLPVAAREIRVAAHDRGIYRGRVAIAAITLFATSWILYSLFEFAGQASSAVGQQIFALQAWGGFIFACGAFTATIDCISREKRDGTLGLLFLTHLKGRDVILGKLVSALALFFSGAIATLPILTLPILLGGIRLSQSFYLLVSLLTTMLFSAAAGMLASALSIKRQHAGGIAAFVVMTFCVAIPLTILSLRKLSQFEAAYLLQFFTPLYMQQLASGAVTGLQFGYFWTCFGIVFATSCVLLAAASFITPRTWQQRAKDPLLKRLTERHAAWTVRTIKSRSPLGRRLLDRNAYEWLAARELSAPTKAWTFMSRSSFSPPPRFLISFVITIPRPSSSLSAFPPPTSCK